ncbi:hypothetical protein NPIL_132831 [Nephila pilipes]|uniref:Uncharacterized protein n=1 Tax=Nephila pilipes TaxID=299642 RepID=A0A8X6NX76_NEPPI|nr:hypothetical protein NPIL_132831 [Nephila pilipes]
MPLGIQKFFIRRAWLAKSGCKFFSRKEKNGQKSRMIISGETESIYLHAEKATYCGLRLDPQCCRSKCLGLPRAPSKSLFALKDR